jgi:hypothetical protein
MSALASTIPRKVLEMTNLPPTEGCNIKAAIVRRKGGPFEIETLTVEEPRSDEVLVRIVATGMCHTDLVIRESLSGAATDRSWT